MDQVNLGMAYRSTTSWMNVVTTKVFPILQSVLDWKICKILFPENQNFSLGCERSELRFSSVCQASQLDTSDLCANTRREFFCLNPWPKQLGKI